MYTYLGRKRPAELFLQFVMSSSSIMIVFLSEMSVAVGSANADCASMADIINAYLKEHPESGLGNILSVEQQQKKLNIMADELLKKFLDSKAYDCEPVRIFLREIITGVVFEFTIKTCSAPEYINGWIVHLLEEGEPELMNAIDAGLDALDQVSSTDLEPASTEDLLTSGFPDSRAVTMEVSADGPQRNTVKLPLTRSESAAERSTDDKIMADLRNPKLYSTATPVQGRYEGESPCNGIETSCRTTPSEKPAIPSNSDRRTHSSALEPRNSATVEGMSASLDSIDDCHVSEPSNESPISSQVDPLITATETVTSMPTATRFHNASISILDDGLPGDDGILRTKPPTEYLLQIEPKSSHLTGWMIARKYADFELLHETLRRISVISGVTEFSKQHSELPRWKNRKSRELRELLEKYVQDALHHECLAECEGMKRFLEKSLATGSQSGSGSTKMGFAFRNPAVLETMGKGVLGVISTAPKGVAEGSKAVLGGVSGIFGSSTAGTKRAGGKSSISRSRSGSRRAAASHTRSATAELPNTRVSGTELDGHEDIFQPSPWEPTHIADEASAVHSPSHSPIEVRANSLKETETGSLSSGRISDSNDSVPNILTESVPEEKECIHRSQSDGSILMSRCDPNSNETSTSHSRSQYPELCTTVQEDKTAHSESSTHAALSEEEAIMAVELLFAVVNEIYGLSSAWKLRKRLLHAAKNFLLRPGNPNLEAIRRLIQDSIIEKNTTHEALASYVNVLGESCFPAQKNDEPRTSPTLAERDQEKLRARARSLLITNGMPTALVSCMGTNATGEALGRIFDSLQIESVSRGFVCAVLLQTLKVMVQ
ncbi:hypothetical protein PRK78_001019 [Emydomyces testavorans]|uniref:PXA domain-containing protein n=1 Tax=Emydomyces testavorans TaxID=2070801 RepID=A0AAF0IGD8_9EURO|nr:hypothetical protein PRK78_001019 [Emydomyces testavorans]